MVQCSVECFYTWNFRQQIVLTFYMNGLSAEVSWAPVRDHICPWVLKSLPFGLIQFCQGTRRGNRVFAQTPVNILKLRVSPGNSLKLWRFLLFLHIKKRNSYDVARIPKIWIRNLSYGLVETAQSNIFQFQLSQPKLLVRIFTSVVR